LFGAGGIGLAAVVCLMAELWWPRCFGGGDLVGGFVLAWFGGRNFLAEPKS
jgi:hypothetical protein